MLNVTPRLLLRSSSIIRDKVQDGIKMDCYGEVGMAGWAWRSGQFGQDAMETLNLSRLSNDCLFIWDDEGINFAWFYDCELIMAIFSK